MIVADFRLIRINGKKLNILSTLVSVLDKEINLNNVDNPAINRD